MAGKFAVLRQKRAANAYMYRLCVFSDRNACFFEMILKDVYVVHACTECSVYVVIEMHACMK